MRTVVVIIVIAMLVLSSKGVKEMSKAGETAQTLATVPSVSKQDVFKTVDKSAQWIKSNGPVVAAEAQREFNEQIRPELEKGLNEIRQ